MILLVLVCRFFGLLVVTCHTVDALMPVAASVVGTLSVAASSARDLQDFPIASRRALKVAHYLYLQFNTHVSGAYTEVMHCTADSITYYRLLLIITLRFKKKPANSPPLIFIIIYNSIFSGLSLAGFIVEPKHELTGRGLRRARFFLLKSRAV